MMKLLFCRYNMDTDRVEPSVNLGSTRLVSIGKRALPS